MCSFHDLLDGLGGLIDLPLRVPFGQMFQVGLDFLPGKGIADAFMAESDKLLHPVQVKIHRFGGGHPPGQEIGSGKGGCHR